MTGNTRIRNDHPLRRLFRSALALGAKYSPGSDPAVLSYVEDEILCGFIHANNLYRVRDSLGRSLVDVAEILIEGRTSRELQGSSREFHIHRYVGDYTLFMLGIFPEALKRRIGKEFIMGSLVIPGGSLSDYYLLQGKKSYRAASEISRKEVFQKLSENFPHYMNTLHFARMYLDSLNNEHFTKARNIIS